MDKILVIDSQINRKDLQELASNWYGHLLKGAVDIQNNLVALGGEWHIDACNVLTDLGGNKETIWGFNILVNENPEVAFEYHSLINLKPSQNHRNMEITDENLRKTIFELVSKKIIW